MDSEDTMTIDELIAEGRRLERPTVLLKPHGGGAVAAWWYESNAQEARRTGTRRRLTVGTSGIPGCRTSVPFMTVVTDEETRNGGTLEFGSSPPDVPALPLYAHSVSVLPPIDAVIYRGSAAIDPWLEENRWNRSWRYNDNFGDRKVAQAYEELWRAEYPAYQPDVYAALGGWHWPGPDDDWHALADEMLLAFTVADAEPWVEAWQLRTGGYRVIQRIT
jgi:hypothetical protein